MCASCDNQSAFQSWDSHALHAALMRRDSAAWTYVYHHVVLAVCKQQTRNGISYSEICRQRDLTPQSIFSALYQRMIVEGKLTHFEFKCHVIYWLQFYARAIIFEACDETTQTVSDLDSISFLWDDDAKESHPLETPMESRLCRERLQACFEQLWRDNPMRAYVFLLRNQEELSAQETARLLGMTPANVDQIHKRAKGDLRQLFSGEGER